MTYRIVVGLTICGFAFFFFPADEAPPFEEPLRPVLCEHKQPKSGLCEYQRLKKN